MSDYLDGRHVLLTGVTGFLGQATLEKLLSAYPTTRISVLIRPKGSQPAASRLPGLLRKDVFKNWRERVGDEVVEQTVAERVTVVEGDLGNDRLPQLPDDLDVVVHSASIVSFDPPIDEAFRINVIGVTRLYDAIKASGDDPHVVHISTAYVAGVRKGIVHEAPLIHDVDWRAEAAAAAAARAEVETQSRRPEILRKAMDAARAEHGKAGPQAVVQAAEPSRRESRRSRRVEPLAGRNRRDPSPALLHRWPVISPGAEP